MADTTFKSKDNGAAFLQPNGPNTKPEWLQCFDIDDIVEDKGGINTLLQCFDVDGEFKTVGFTVNAPAPFTFNMGTYAGKRKEALEQGDCPMSLYLMLRECGKANIMANYVRGAVVDIGTISQRSFIGWVKRSEDMAAELSFQATGLPPVLDVFQLRNRRQASNETSAINNIVFADDARCAGRCGARQLDCQNGLAVSDFLIGSPADVAGVVTTTNGATWAQTAAQPFAAGESIVGAVRVPLDGTNERFVVARGTTDAGNPAEIAYSDDSGATWSNVNVGSTNGQFTNDSDALFALDKDNIWLVTDDGYIYKSEDAAETWSVQESAAITTGAYNGVYFADVFTGLAVGDSDIVAVTVDGGLSWSAATATGGANNLLSIGYSGLFWWTGDSGGNLYYSDDNGTTWTARAGWTGSGTGEVAAIDFNNKYFGMIAHNSGGTGTILMTPDGGYTWLTLVSDTNAGFNDIYICGTDLAYVAGEVSGSTGYIGKITVEE